MTPAGKSLYSHSQLKLKLLRDLTGITPLQLFMGLFYRLGLFVYVPCDNLWGAVRIAAHTLQGCRVGPQIWLQTSLFQQNKHTANLIQCAL